VISEPDAAELASPGPRADHDAGWRRAFIAEVCELANSRLVVLALRADFYGHAVRYPGLARARQFRQVVQGPMTAALGALASECGGMRRRGQPFTPGE
jgi:hypothetical protein